MEEILSTVEIDPSGDVCFELSCPDGKAHVLVSSKVLSLASPVFAAMFTSQFKEALTLRKASTPTPIPLPDEDGPAFVFFCAVIHYQTDEVPKKPTLECLENLGIICDKYSCTKALAPWSEMWLSSEAEQLTDKDIERCLSIAYTLDSPDAFSRISWEMIYSQVGPFNPLEMTNHDLITGNIFAELEARRAEIHLSVMKAIEIPLATLLDKTSCSGSCESPIQHLRALKSWSLWPLARELPASSISEFMKRIGSFQKPNVTQCRPNCYSCKQNISFDFKDAMREEKERILSSRVGVCLDCVKSDRESRRNQTCRIKHA